MFARADLNRNSLSQRLEPKLRTSVQHFATSLHHSSTTLLCNTCPQHFTTTLLHNTCVEHSPTSTLLHNTSPQHFFQNTSPSTHNNTLPQHSYTTLLHNCLRQHFSRTLVRIPCLHFPMFLHFSRTLSHSSLQHLEEAEERKQEVAPRIGARSRSRVKSSKEQ